MGMERQVFMPLHYLLEPAMCSCFESSPILQTCFESCRPEAGRGTLEHPGGGDASPEKIPEGWQSGKGGL